MAWPIVGTGVTIRKNASTPQPVTIAWGTENITQGNLLTAIVKSLRSSAMVEEVKIEQGSGLTATDVVINDGSEIEITCVDDRVITWPVTGETISVYNPLPTGVATVHTAVVVNNAYNAAAKKEGERVLLCKNYTLIDG